jgi:nucleoside-diphosphate-sugar epimerase
MARADEGDVRWHQADLLEPTAAAALLGSVRPTHLLHLAWYAEHGEFWTSPENERWADASVRLLRAFAAAGGHRAAAAGTCAEYDWGGGGVLSEETTPLAPRTPYGKSKDAVRAAALALAAETGTSVVWGRIFFLYGPHEDERRLVASVTRSLLLGRTARTSHGRQVRDFLHTADAADAFVHLLDADVEGAVNVASGEAVAIRDVVARIADLVGQPGLVELGALEPAASDPPVLVADVGRLRDELGWRPRRSLDEGLAEVVEWWRRELKLA